MITNSAPTNEAVLSNVGETGEFKIRNSQKAFGILSSGLYANKIRAIVRELSCNAYDSHVEAGRKDVPFDLHLPTSLEPWFAIRDYGTGLNHEQVIDILTVYFESTKTTSNDFIGTLGLGSKSPFSYTDNFTVTAIKDHMKRVYTAYINGSGVPSVALMFEGETNEADGVEIRFGVEDSRDARKFVDEASSVFVHFATKPNFTGAPCNVHTYNYTNTDIVPGVNLISNRRQPVAVMGNIEYPIEVPNPKSNLGELAELLSYPLEMRFEIGELDIQASREGLSYIPATIAAIHKKLKLLNEALVHVVAEEADAIENEWERAIFLTDKVDRSHMWEPAVKEYTRLTGFDLIRGWNQPITFTMGEADIANDYNVKLSGFVYSRGASSLQTLQSSKTRDPNDYSRYVFTWHVQISEDKHFVVNDTKIGVVERAKYHWKNSSDSFRSTVVVLNPADKTKPMDTDGFFKALRNPPNVMLASELMEKPRKSSVRSDATVSILSLVATGDYARARSYVWRDAGTLACYKDSTKEHYYLPLSGYALVSNYGGHDAKDLGILLLESKMLNSAVTIYGVRKSDIKNIEKRANWINVEDLFVEKAKAPEDSFVCGIARDMLNDRGITIEYKQEMFPLINDKNSDFFNIVSKVRSARRMVVGRREIRALEALNRRYKTFGAVDPIKMAEKVADECEAELKKYPMLEYVNPFQADAQALADYVNMVDAVNSKKV